MTQILSRHEKKSSATEWIRRMLCVVCHKQTPVVHGAGRPRKYCSTACRQRAYRQRHQHVGGTHRPGTAHRGGGVAGQVIAVVLLPAALTGYADQKTGAGPVLEVGIVGVAHIHCRPATPTDSEEQETSEPPDRVS
jgi:hypothetical protein